MMCNIRLLCKEICVCVWGCGGTQEMELFMSTVGDGKKLFTSMVAKEGRRRMDPAEVKAVEERGRG